MSNRSSGVILLGILAVAGLGLSGYMFFKNELLFPIRDSGLILVGIWNDLDENRDYTPYTSNSNWLLEFRNSPRNNSNYVSVTNSNTRIDLLRVGYYKISLSALFTDVDANNRYNIEILKNDAIDMVLYRILQPTAPSETTYYVDSSRYVYSDGDDYFAIRCFCSSSDTAFYVVGTEYHQFSIEYVV